MDIDSDFCIYRGPEVFQHLIDKYGQSHVANVATFGRLQSKQVIKDIAKSLLYIDISETEIDTFLIHPFLNNRYMILN
jgi:DNA polymerase-3 subunit alpha